jgi:hypothetical protein
VQETHPPGAYLPEFASRNRTKDVSRKNFSKNFSKFFSRRYALLNAPFATLMKTHLRREFRGLPNTI